jgi:hypothetical protein
VTLSIVATLAGRNKVALNSFSRQRERPKVFNGGCVVVARRPNQGSSTQIAPICFGSQHAVLQSFEPPTLVSNTASIAKCLAKLPITGYPVWQVSLLTHPLAQVFGRYSRSLLIHFDCGAQCAKKQFYGDSQPRKLDVTILVDKVVEAVGLMYYFHA